MADTDGPEVAQAAVQKQDDYITLRPTLFIGVGGTGLEVMLRVRRRILNEVWGPKGQPYRLESLADFPIAQFLHFDLDRGAVLEATKPETMDLMADLVKLTDEDRVVENFDMDRYSRSQGDLDRFPHIKQWSPLSPERIRQLGIDPSKGAGQIRAIARLYFFDKYPKLKDRIHNKLIWLQTGLSKDVQFKQLGLELERTKFRIVVIGSVAGGTGGGSFVDMGWLAGWQARGALNSDAFDIELMLFMPSGYRDANKDRTEANGYASLMELETYMREGPPKGLQWDNNENPPTLNALAYNEVYLVDSGNLAGQHTGDQSDVYDMVADALFEDFKSAEFAKKKRSVAVNQRQHKITPWSPDVPRNLYGDMKLSYYKGYSAFGQAILDTQNSVKRDIRAHQWVSAMLKAFFGVAGEGGGNRATDKQRDEFMVAHMHLGEQPFTDFPDFSSKEIQLKQANREFYDYALTTDLLTDRYGSIVGMVQQKVDGKLEAVANGFERKQWATQVREEIKQLETDAVRDANATADVVEDRVSRRRREMFDEITKRVRDQLYNYLDNKQYGGLEFVLSLVEQIKERLENKTTGLVRTLTLNAERYQEIKEALRIYEYELLLRNLGQVRGGFGVFGVGDRQSRTILDQLKVEIGNYLKFHLRQKAAAEGAQLLGDISKWLGERVEMDAAGNARWNGLVGELQAGRQAVLGILSDIDKRVAILREDENQDHATYRRVEAPEREIPVPPAAQLREWADEAFKDFGGSRKLFPMLRNTKARPGLFAKLRAKAEKEMPFDVMAGGSGQDPLVTALKAMPPAERQRRFKDLLERATPWISANIDGDVRPSSDQFRCYLGVERVDDWEQFREELRARVPTQAGIRAIDFVDTGIPGRAVCYTELSGIPLAVLRGLDNWRSSYRKEFDRIPLHTDLDATRFSHPAAPSTDELARLAEDFRTFLLAVMVGVLVRDPSERVPAGQYQFTVGRGDVRRMGNERAFRLNGLPANFRPPIQQAVAAKVDGMSKAQLGALSTLASVYAAYVYKTRLVPDETGTEFARKGFAAAVAEQLASALKDRARRKGATDADLRDIDEACQDARLPEWTDVIPDSDADAYAWEVRSYDIGEDPRLKRTVKPEFFNPGWFEANVLAPRPETPAQPAGIPSVPELGRAPVPTPPTLPTAFQYYIAPQGQQSGPHPLAFIEAWVRSGQLHPTALAWRDGLSGWVPLSQIPELAALFVSAPPPLPGGPPPLPGA